MPFCIVCQSYNDVTEIVCIQCGQPLLGGDDPTTRDISEDLKALFLSNVMPLFVPDAVVPLMLPAPRPISTNVKLHVSGGSQPLAIDHNSKEDIVLGRRSPYGEAPTIDLTDYKAYLLGVSRLHAVLRFNEEKRCSILDLGSANGTWVNGQRLASHTPRTLNHGDEIWLAGLHLRIELY
jgi:hypothetical protein